MISLLPLSLDRDPSPTNIERVRRNHHDVLAEIQGGAFTRARIIRDVTLADGIATPVAHGLGVAAFAILSPPRGPIAAGWIEEVRDGGHDRTKYVVLKANSYGATVTVDLVVVPL
jgi:hypothetical protein